MVSDVGGKRRWMLAETHAKAATKALASACEFASTPLIFINYFNNIYNRIIKFQPEFGGFF